MLSESFQGLKNVFDRSGQHHQVPILKRLLYVYFEIIKAAHSSGHFQAFRVPAHTANMHLWVSFFEGKAQRPADQANTVYGDSLEGNLVSHTSSVTVSVTWAGA